MPGGDEALHRLEILREGPCRPGAEVPVHGAATASHRPPDVVHGRIVRRTRPLHARTWFPAHHRCAPPPEDHGRTARAIRRALHGISRRGRPARRRPIPTSGALAYRVRRARRTAELVGWDRRRSPSHPQRSALAMARNLWLTRSAARWPEWLAADVHLIDRRVPTASSRSAKQARQQSPATAGWIFSSEGNWVVYAKARQQHAKCATDLFIIARGWSLYGAPWLQPVAIGGKSVVGENGGTKRKPLPAAATSCLRRSMVRSSP